MVWRVQTYLQWTTTGPAWAGFNVLTFFRNFSIPMGVKGTPKSGQLVKWSCVTSLSALQPSCSCREHTDWVGHLIFHAEIYKQTPMIMTCIPATPGSRLKDQTLTAFVQYKHGVELPYILKMHVCRENWNNPKLRYVKYKIHNSCKVLFLL